MRKLCKHVDNNTNLQFFPYKLQFTKYRISDPSAGTYLKFRLCDMRGLEENMDVKSEDIACLLDGNLPNKYKV